MSGIYQVYLRFHRPSNADIATRHGRWLLTFPSRFVADEVFRDLQTLRSPCDNPMFSVLERVGPQYWIYDSPNDADGIGEAWNRILKLNWVMSGSKCDLYRQNIILHPIGDALGNSAAFPCITNPVQGPDWLNQGIFYIRSRSSPDLYWYADQHGLVTVRNSGDRTRFRISAPALGDKKLVLKRDDDIIITVHTFNCAGGDEAEPEKTPGKMGPGDTFEFEDNEDVIKPFNVSLCSLRTKKGTVIRGDQDTPEGRLPLKFRDLFTQIGFVHAHTYVAVGGNVKRQELNVAVRFHEKDAGEEWELV